MAFCTRCGSANAEQATLCIRCGTRLSRGSGPITVFYSYSHKDEDLRNRLEAHLAPLRRSGLIREWHDRKIIAGQDWDKQISRYLESAELILFLISADFLNSNYIFDVEVRRALERQSAGQADVVPVILRPVVWKLLPELSRLQALPENARPVTEWPSLDLAFVSICEGIAAVVLARAASAGPLPSPDVSPPRPTTARGRRRVLDAALPARAPLAKPSTLLVLVRRTDSPGLRAIVEAQPEYGIAAKDIDNEPLTLKFPVDQNGTPQPLDLNVKIESPQFEPRSQTKNIRVPPRGDSPPRVFLLTPTQVGPLVANVEVCQGERMIAGCVLHSFGVETAAEAEDAPPPQSVASASLGTPVEEGDEVALEVNASEGARPASAPPERQTLHEPPALSAAPIPEQVELELRRQAAERACLEEERKQAAEQARFEEEQRQAAEKARLEQEERERVAAAEKARSEQQERQRLAAEQARLEHRTLHEPPPRPPAGYRDTFQPAGEAPSSPAPQRRSFFRHPLWLTGLAAVLFLAVIGGNVLMQPDSRGGTLSAPIPITPVLALIALAVLVFVIVRLRRR